VNVFLIDPHSIYRRGLAASLETLESVESVGVADSVEDAWDEPLLLDADVVIVDRTVAGALEFIAAVRESTGARVIVCTSQCDEDTVVSSLQAGAVGFLEKESLTPDGLAAAVQVAESGNGVLAPDLLSALARGVTDGRPKTVRPGGRLTDREQRVLSLIAQGHATREVAERLCYSERTVKNVLHDVVTKLDARSRSQAVARAVRAGLI